MICLTHIASRQKGAALVVGLILLVVLTLMAISSMNTATLDLVMAGNEQFRQRAFTAAEAGIEQAISNGTFTTGGSFTGTAASSGIGNDTYQYSVNPGNSFDVGPPSGYTLDSGGTLSAAYFTITSTGTSARNSQVTNTQGIAEVVNSSTLQTCLSGTTCSLTASGSGSGP